MSRQVIFQGPPLPRAVRWQAPGDSVTGAVYQVREVQERTFGTNEPAVYKSGDPKMQLVVDMIVVDFSDDLTVSGGRGRPAVTLAEHGGVDREVTAYVKGRDKSLFFEALSQLDNSQMCLGDLLTVTYTHDGTPGAGVAARKHREYTFTANDDPDMEARCELARSAVLARFGGDEDDEPATIAKASSDDDDEVVWDDMVSDSPDDSDLPSTGPELRVWCDTHGISGKTVQNEVRKQNKVIPSMSAQEIEELARNLLKAS